MLLQLIFALFTGYLFGFITACEDTLIYGISAFWPYYLQGVYFDTLHGVGNLLFFVLLIPFFAATLFKVLAELKKIHE
ncbi:hypothetical protein RV10_GL000639 [Enterococcus pallens]|nr:hypothetical protein RV10_GL000639 [Enterococcus pallens]